MTDVGRRKSEVHSLFSVFRLIGEVPRVDAEYIDQDVRNEETYYYAIVAVDNLCSRIGKEMSAI